jgi:L-fucose isomerase-like protein
MYKLQLTSGSPSALVDWNTNYGDDLDDCVLLHCGKLGEGVPAEHLDSYG